MKVLRVIQDQGIKKTIQASHHEGHARYGRSAGCLSVKVICLLKEMIYLQITETMHRVKEAMGSFLQVLVLVLHQDGGIIQYLFVSSIVEIQLGIMIQMERRYFCDFVWLVL